MSLQTDIRFALTATLSKALDLVTGSAPLSFSRTVMLADGTGAGQASKIFSDRRTLAASASEELDLAGSLIDAFGDTITFAAIKALIVAADGANTNDVQVGGSAANGFNSWVGAAGDLVVVRPGGLLVAVAGVSGYTVMGGTGDLLKIANAAAGTPVTYDIVLVGV